MCKAINTFRAQHGRPPLKVSVALVRAAEWMSKDMANHDNLSHDDSHGRDFVARLKAFGYNKPTKGENIAQRRELGRGHRDSVEELAGAPRDHAQDEVQGHGRRPRAPPDARLVLDRGLRRHGHPHDADLRRTAARGKTRATSVGRQRYSESACGATDTMRLPRFMPKTSVPGART